MMNITNSRRFAELRGQGRQKLVTSYWLLAMPSNAEIRGKPIIHRTHIIGIDEVGRGALAGPVVVAGIASTRPFRFNSSGLGKLRDSKKLTAGKREKWFRRFVSDPAIKFAVSRVTPRVIDRINISRAADRAALRVIKRLGFDRRRVFAYLDGGLFLPPEIPHQTIIKGDEKIKLIAAASIVAKVTRDRYMRRLHKKEPRYDFHIHKGYGTKLHISHIKQLGYSDFHRKSFKIKS